MALPTTLVWEVRTTGSDNNGGGFVSGGSGTDYSQQNSAQYTFTDLVSVSSLVVSSASHNFVAADVDNLIHITAGTGFTVGFYRIVSVSSNQATLDRSPGTVGVGGTYAVGGALASPVTALANVVAQNTVYIKADGTYTTTATAVVANVDSQGSGSLNALQIIGYTTTRTDNGQVTWTTATNSNLLIQLQNNGVTFGNFKFSNTAATRADCVSWVNNANYYVFWFYNCVFDGFNIAINLNAVGNAGIHGLWITNCEIKNSISHGLSLASGNQTNQIFVYACYIHGNGGSGILIPNTTTLGTYTIQNCIIVSNTARGIRIDNASQAGNENFFNIINNTIANNTSDGLFSSATAANPWCIIGNIFYNNGGYGVNMTTRAGIVNVNFDNFYYLNTTAARNNFPVGVGDVTGTANPFNNDAGGDYSLNSTAGGGAVCRNAGYPASIP